MVNRFIGCLLLLLISCVCFILASSSLEVRNAVVPIYSVLEIFSILSRTLLVVHLTTMAVLESVRVNDIVALSELAFAIRGSYVEWRDLKIIDMILVIFVIFRVSIGDGWTVMVVKKLVWVIL